jgi:hypothetical protein
MAGKRKMKRPKIIISTASYIATYTENKYADPQNGK